MQLIPQWRRAWRMFSVQAQALAFAILGAWQVMPEEMKATLPPGAVYWASMALLVAGIIGRLVVQPKVSE